jgi:PAS domain S-box-containing protein
MKAVLDSANDAFVAVGRDGLVTQWSVQARHMFGFEPAEAVGREFTALLGGAQGLVIPSQLWDGSGGGMRRVEVAAVRKDGERLPVELSIAPFSDGVTDGASIFVRDLTQQRAAERQLEQVRQDLLQAQKLDAIGKLTGGVAHDFNNVLQVIGGNLALLQSQLAQQPAARRLAEAASSAVDRGAKLSSQLLAFARRQPLQPLPLNVNRRVQAMDELLRRSLGERVEIETVLAAGLWTTLADPNQLENVLLNLAINARDAMPEGGRLTIETGNAVLEESYTAGFEALEPGQYVMVAVSDTGTGMPPEVAARAFEPFFTTKGEGKGTGLGLSMAYGFAKQSGGHIRIYSEPGSGTTIKLYLPRSLEPEAQIEASRAGPVRGGDETVLVVEDDLPVQTAVVNMLQALGYRTLRANDAQSALEILQSGEPVDLLFTDVVMPGPLRSPELAREARRLRPALAVLFTSGYTQNAIVHGGRLDPGVELLSKPYRQEELARKVRKLLDARPVQAEPAPPQAARVLLVEDEADLRASTHELLQLLGIEVDSVATAEEARERLATGRYGLLLTDLSLPGESGSELAAWAAAHDAQLRIVFASGLGGNFTPPPGLRFTILAKPYGVEELQRVLQGSVGQPAGETA